ncbi:hypothetical protein BC832DRAFT_564677 [Gaertneriomyces semiglobifer]|nr:hypothetical protein BC832DRAFT_564677 [Gaertneriomyces semiglobifer]
MTVSEPKSVLVTLDYSDLVRSDIDLSSQLRAAFGNDEHALGAVLVKNIPDFVKLRQRLLTLASTLANLPSEALQKAEHVDSSYLFGWSHGKEIMNGKRDWAKGSFYNNPVYDFGDHPDPEYAQKFPEYGYPNVWTEELPELKTAFTELGKLIVDTGMLVAKHCDKYLASEFPDLPEGFLEGAIRQSRTTKARLLHYFPVEKAAEEQVQSSTKEEEVEDSWCGLHIDHSMLTGLTSAMYINEISEPYQELNTSSTTLSPSLSKAISQSGLYVKTRSGNMVKVNIPKDCALFQIGEAAQVASRGLLVATPHLVKGAEIGKDEGRVARNTFAVFMQPNVDAKLTPTQTFHDFTQEVMKRHYADRM